MSYFPCYDHNGNSVAYVSESGDLSAQYVYDPYGNLLAATGPLASQFAFGFSTKIHDREAGLISYQRRFYSPSLGRWLNRDSIEEDGGENLYAFCGNSPSYWVDSIGEKISILEDKSIVRDNIGSSSRAVFRRNARIEFFCSRLGQLEITGSAYRKIAILTPGLSQWDKRYKRYDEQWGQERSSVDEWKAAYAHEKDHWNSYNEFFAFLKMLNEFDGEFLCSECPKIRDSLKHQYHVLWNKAVQRSARYDLPAYNYGGAYPK